MKSVLITPEGIQKNLKNIKPLDAICEYIWNGFDAFATQVEVELHRNKNFNHLMILKKQMCLRKQIIRYLMGEKGLVV